MADVGREARQYAPLEQFLRQSGCNPVWRVGKGNAIKLDVLDPQFRTPDAVGAERVGDSWHVHVIEAKLFARGGYKIDEGMAQLKSVQRYADYLYLSLESADWSVRSEQQQAALIEKVTREGFGLLLVGGKKVTVEVKSQRNGDVTR